MDRIAAAACCFLLSCAGALAQSGGGGGSAGGGAAAGGASRSGGGAAAAAARGATAPGSATSGTSGTAGTVPGVSPGRPAPGVGNTPTDPQRNNVDANPATRLLPGTTANAPNGSAQPGGTSAPGVQTPSSSGRPDPGGANSSAIGAGAGKDPAKSAVADCLGLWDKGTHMTKGEWAATCNRVQGRLDNLKVDPVSPPTATKRERSARGHQE